MKSSRKNDGERSVFDVRKGTEREHTAKGFWKKLLYGKNVVNLKPKFRGRHPWAWALGLGVLLILIFLGIRGFSTKAEIQDFYPSACLGNWQNTNNAQGQPETLAIPSSSFNDQNSAVYVLNTQVYCGGFVPNSFNTSGTITNVGLTLVWQVGDVATTSDQTISPPSATTSTDDTSSSAATSSDDTTVDSSTDSSTAPLASSSPTSFSPIHNLFSELVIARALADDSSTDLSAPSDDTSTDSSTVILGPPLIANLAPATSSSSSSPSSTPTDDNASSTTGTDSSTPTELVPPPPAPPIPDENFLDVSYSTDGQTWIDIGEVNINNWQQFTVTLPISSWDDLKNLQIRVEGIPTTEDPIPPIYLDGMLMEVHYEISAPIVAPPSDTPTSTEEQATSTSIIATPAAPQRITLVDPGAGQTCQVEPFSQPLPLGGSTDFTIVLHPSINGVSYDLLTGYLPAGISATIGSPTGPIAATSSLTFTASASARTGSLNIPVIYHEHEANGTILSNFCQLNIVVQ